jgi:hypothetical protein
LKKTKTIARNITKTPNRYGALGDKIYNGMAMIGDMTWPTGMTMPRNPLAAP